MNKEANTNYPVVDLIKKRWSPRAFSERMVEEEKLLSLLEAARWAPSSFNEQPWRFIVATRDNQAEFEKLLGCLVEGNLKWAKDAPVLMLTIAKLRFSRNDKPNRHAFHDVGLAVGNLVIQATALGLFVHQMAGIHVDKARETYTIPEGYEPVAGIAIGYHGEPESLPEKYQKSEEAERTRKPLSELVFAGGWEQMSPLVE
ncbi:nitroreductase family protein [candidate division KSB1 bacterium]|nr:nitroreductase family protein [candidate division KSB1 bacterium]NIR69680.1 nitroreductase family protein [candidate division KSB1 bacterium]NIS24330.1 nitroreductase family protein [candidate division KSB1 bacterium]NIT71258.1 nitroreductase family protein [candidate division KSB1 bacterium]NIU24964.1 nitroreductase family protein [candidate division KSB1 bacterium]